MGPFESEETIQLSHTWDTAGDYTIQAKARDTRLKESEWSILEVSMSKQKQVLNLFQSFIERYPLLSSLFQINM